MVNELHLYRVFISALRLPHVHPFIHRRRCHSCKATTNTSGAVRVRWCLAQGHLDTWLGGARGLKPATFLLADPFLPPELRLYFAHGVHFNNGWSSPMRLCRKATGRVGWGEDAFGSDGFSLPSGKKTSGSHLDLLPTWTAMHLTLSLSSLSLRSLSLSLLLCYAACMLYMGMGDTTQSVS